MESFKTLCFLFSFLAALVVDSWSRIEQLSYIFVCLSHPLKSVTIFLASVIAVFNNFSSRGRMGEQKPTEGDLNLISKPEDKGQGRFG